MPSWASESEIELLAKGGAALAHSPTECVANLNAVPNMLRFRAAGIRVALGCDNQGNDMFDTMRAAWLIHGARWGVERYDPEFLPPGDLLAMATIESANVLCADDLIGSLEVGKAADLVVLDGNAPHLMAQHYLASDIVRFATRGEVRATVVAGKVLYKDGAFTTIDIERLRAEASAGAAYVRGVVEGQALQACSSLLIVGQPAVRREGQPRLAEAEAGPPGRATASRLPARLGIGLVQAIGGIGCLRAQARLVDGEHPVVTQHEAAVDHHAVDG